MKTYIAEILEAEDGSGDSILQLPEDFCKEENWLEGDTLEFEVEGQAIIIRNIDRNKRESIPK